MKIQVISQGSTSFEHWIKKWGLSILIDEDILFDTFCDGNLLKADLDKNGIDSGKIKHIVLSHEHWDHTGGLWYVLENNKNVKVYVCKGFSTEFKDRIKASGCQLVETIGPISIKENILTTGEIECYYKSGLLCEQALIIKQQDKMAILTGCSHPGILKILSLIEGEHRENIDLLLGGLHLLHKSDKEITEITAVLQSIHKIKTIAAFHCTGHKAVQHINKQMPQKLPKVRSGDCFAFNKEAASWELVKRVGK